MEGERGAGMVARNGVKSISERGSRHIIGLFYLLVDSAKLLLQ